MGTCRIKRHTVCVWFKRNILVTAKYTKWITKVVLSDVVEWVDVPFPGSHCSKEDKIGGPIDNRKILLQGFILVLEIVQDSRM